MTELEKPGEVHSVLLKNDAGKLEPVNLPKDVDANDFQTVCNIAFWIQVMRRITPTMRDVSAHASFPKERINGKRLKRIFTSAAYSRAAEIMGFSIPTDIPTLTQEQELAILVLTDPTIRGGLSQRLKVAGVGMATYRAWLSDQLFRETIDSIGSRLLKDHETDLMVALTSAAADGDINAVKFAFEVSGRHSPAQQQALDVQMMLEKVVEIIAAEVKDEATLARIGTRLIGLRPAIDGHITADTERANDANSYNQIRAD